MTLNELRKEKVGLCVSGGLDSRTIATRLKEEGIDILCFVADLCQPDEKNINDVAQRMSACGVETVIVDLKKEMADACFTAIKAQAMYDGGYWNSTGLARAVTVRGLLPEMKKRGCTVLAHGATGRGNDQMRFERYTNVLAPEMKVYAPWRDPILLKQFPGRKQMAQYLREKGIETTLKKRRYSTDANLAGISYEAEDLEKLTTPCTIVKPRMGVWPHEAPARIEKFKVRFEHGIAVEINGQKVSPLEAMLIANRIGGRNGIGIKNSLENRIIGTKSRGVYEAPGMELLGTCLRMLYYAVMDRRALHLFNYLSTLAANQIYDGRMFDPATVAALNAINILAQPATGVVEVGLYKGNIYFRSLTECPSTLYHEADSSMEATKGLNPVSSQGYAEIQSVEARALAKAHQIKSELPR